MARKPPFAPLPLRALFDRQLSELHLRALGIIGYHDRRSLVSGKGQGCWASSASMADTIGCNPTNMSAAISYLINAGYVLSEPREADKRKRCYRVIYRDEDWEGRLPLGQTIGGDDNLPQGQTTDQSARPDCLPRKQTTSESSLPEGKQSQKVVCPDLSANPQKTAKSPSQEIMQSIRDSAEAVIIDSAEAARFDQTRDKSEQQIGDDFSSPDLRSDEMPHGLGNGHMDAPSENVGGRLAQFERLFQSDSLSLDLDAWADWLEEIALGDDAQHAGRAQRLLEAIDALGLHDPEETSPSLSPPGANATAKMDAMVQQFTSGGFDDVFDGLFGKTDKFDANGRLIEDYADPQPIALPPPAPTVEQLALQARVNALKAELDDFGRIFNRGAAMPDLSIWLARLPAPSWTRLERLRHGRLSKLLFARLPKLKCPERCQLRSFRCLPRYWRCSEMGSGLSGSWVAKFLKQCTRLIGPLTLHWLRWASRTPR